MRFTPDLIPATLLRRYKRFLADVRLGDGTEVTVHCPNPGSMLRVSVPGRPVLLSHSDDPKRKLPLTWEMIRLGRSWVGVHTGRTNGFVAEALEQGRIGELRGYARVRREVKVGDSRLDFQLDGNGGPPCLVEVKNVTLTGTGPAATTAVFPDSVTRRGQKHLRELIDARRQGHRAVMLFWINRQDCGRFAPADEIDPEYGRILRQAHDAGVEILAYRAKLSPQQVTVDGSIPIVL